MQCSIDRREFGTYRWQPGNRVHCAADQITLDQLGCEAGKIPAAGNVFLLTPTFVEQLGHWKEILTPRTGFPVSNSMRIDLPQCDPSPQS